MRILVIGGTRFIGPRVDSQLVARGHRVTVFHRGQHSSFHRVCLSSSIDDSVAVLMTFAPMGTPVDTTEVE